MEKEKLLEYLKDNTNILRTMVLEVNSYNGHLDYLDYYENDDYFFETFYDIYLYRFYGALLENLMHSYL